MPPTFSTPPPSVPETIVSFPQPHVLLVTLNRPKQLNALRRDMHPLLDKLWRWYDAEPSLRCAVLTGTGRAFCAGADLKEWDKKNSGHEKNDSWESAGFGGVSNRLGKKPIIGAINGICFGGGMEMALNLDMMLASKDAKFGLPEVKRGVVAIAGALPRLMRTVGRQRATEMALLGRPYTAQEMLNWGVVNAIVNGPSSSVVDEALRWAGEMAENSPDSVLVSRAGLMGGWEAEDPRASTKRVEGGIYRGLDGGENMKEGLASFAERRKPVWKDSKL